MKKIALAVFIPLLMLMGFKQESQPTTQAVVGATLVNTNGSAPLKNAVVLIRGNKIQKVGAASEVQIPKDAQIIQADGKWIIPGLCDAHVHFFQSGGLYTRPDIIDLRKHVPYKDEMAQIRERLPDTFARYIRCGITTAVDVGGPFWNFEVRDRAAKTALAPRVAVAGPLISTYQPAALTTDDPPIIKMNSPDEAREMVRKQAEKKPDLIKIWYIARTAASIKSGLPMVQATIEEAHKLGLRVAVHATELETARAAVKAGADILVHSIDDAPVDQDLIDAMKKNNVIYITTIMVRESYDEVLGMKTKLTAKEIELANPFVVSTLFDLRKLKESSSRGGKAGPSPTALKNAKKLHEAGIPIAAGTDAGNIGTLHGPSLFYELELLAKAGLTPIEILKSATIHGARVAGFQDKLGTIEEGKLADMVILNSDPLADINNVGDIHLVIKDGRAFKLEEVLKPTPADIVQRQVNAYNARDIDAFLATYSPDIELYKDEKVATSGRDNMRERYRKFFEDNPKLHCEIADRKVDGNFVTDQEKVTGLKNGKTMEATAKYEVENGLIRRVWFTK